MKKAKIPRRSKGESSLTSNKTRLNRSEMSIHKTCSKMLKLSQSFRLRKSVNTKLTLMPSKCSSEKTKTKSYSKKSSIERKWNLNKPRSTSKRKVISS